MWFKTIVVPKNNIKTKFKINVIQIANIKDLVTQLV
jgi:hypothetical protein